MSSSQPFIFHSAETWEFSIDCFYADGAPIDLTGGSIELTLTDRGRVLRFDSSSAPEFSWRDRATGKGRFIFDRTVTSLFPGDSGALYQAKATRADGWVSVQAQGTITVKPTL